MDVSEYVNDNFFVVNAQDSDHLFYVNGIPCFIIEGYYNTNYYIYYITCIIYYVNVFKT